MGMQIYDEQSAICQPGTLNAASGTTPVAVMSESVLRGRLDHIILSSTSAEDEIVQLYVRYSAANYLMGEITVPALAGTPGIPCVDLVPVQWDGCDGLQLSSMNTYCIAVNPALTGGETINFVTFGGVY